MGEYAAGKLLDPAAFASGNLLPPFSLPDRGELAGGPASRSRSDGAGSSDWRGTPVHRSIVPAEPVSVVRGPGFNSIACTGIQAHVVLSPILPCAVACLYRVLGLVCSRVC